MLMLKPRGFTIVELLIVIVVIAILASISVVAFNGIRERAENTKTVTAVGQFAKGLVLYKSREGVYPLQTANNFWCVGQGSSCGAETNLSGNTCNGVTNIPSQPNLGTEMASTLGQMPVPSDQYMDCGTSPSTLVKVRGIIYYTNGSASVMVFTYLKGDQSCPRLTGGQAPAKQFIAPQTTICSVLFT